MSSSFKVKVVAAGWNPAKSAFFRGCEQNLNSFFKSSFITVGIDIKTISHSSEQGDSITISLWDINSAQRFRFMTPTFFRGAVACLLFHDLSAPQSFEELDYWVEQARLYARQVPIYLVGLKFTNLKDKIDLENLNEFIERNEISRFYPCSIHKESRTSQILEDIVSRIFEHIVYYRPNDLKLSDQEKSLYEKFLVTFSRCPICSTKNHQSNLNRIFFSQDSNIINMKRNLINFIQSSEYCDEIPMEKLKIGILCCSCYKKVFS